LGVESCIVIPVSALNGDNVAERSEAARWYDGPTILEALEEAPAGEWAGAHGDRRGSGARLPVQWVLRQPGGGRTYAGMVNGGPLRQGDDVVVLPGGQRSTVRAVETLDGARAEAAVGLSVSVQLADDVDVSRGDLLAAADDPPDVVTQLVATVCWFDPRPLTAGAQYRIKHTTRVTPARIVSVDGRLDVNRLELLPADSLAVNDIGTVTLAVATPLAVDPYHRNRITGSFVVIDPTTNGTVAAGMVGPPALTPLEPDPARLDAHA
jgi:sulfate adenylyltransferase subunit 1 (EFTu-like GTPase family)